MKRVRLRKNLEERIRAGHPWIFDQAVEFPAARPAPGELVLVERQGRPLAIAYADPDSPISLRVLTLDVGAIIDGDWVAGRVARAVDARRSIVGTNALRLVHGENDFMPGLVLDRYADVGVLVYDGVGAERLWAPHAARIRQTAGVVAPPTPRAPNDRAKGAQARDPASPGRDASLTIDEHGARFEVDLVRGQKTGLFLDQRENRLRVRELAAGARVLNLFCYTGGFSIHAALGGARQVTSVDQAAPAMAALLRNLALNRLDANAHELVVGDAFAFLAQAAQHRRTWDLVVCDPPSFAPSAHSKAKALVAYRRLNRLAAAVVEPGGMLVSASCSSHVTEADLLDVLAHCQRPVRVVHMAGAGADHPVAAGFPEGRYLKCLFAVVDPQ